MPQPNVACAAWIAAVPATMASIGTLIEPLTASFLAALFLGERLTPSGLLGAGLLLSSLAILSFGNRQQSTD